MQSKGERQDGQTMSDIRENHRARYEYAIRCLRRYVPPPAVILDAACGPGYGSVMLAEAGYKVYGVDCSEEAIEHARAHFAHDLVEYRVADLINRDDQELLNLVSTALGIVSIETIEHVSDDWLDILAERSHKLIVGTVPNQDVVPFDPQKHPWHLRHYTKAELVSLFGTRGYSLSDWETQYGKWIDYAMRPGDDGMTLGFVARGF